MTRRRIVVLPEPLGPIRVTRSPLRTTKSRSCNTTWSPKRFSTLLKRIAGISPSSSVIAPVWVSSGGVFKAFLQLPGEERAQKAGDQVDETGDDDGLDETE